MTLFAFSYVDLLAYSLVTQIPELHRAQFEISRFPNGELHTHIDSQPSGTCIVLGSIQPPDERLVSYLLLCDTVARQGTGALTAVLPYLAYSRHDKPGIRQSLCAAWIGQMLAACGVDRVVTLDIHSQRVSEMFPIPIQSLSTAKLFASNLGEMDKGVGIVSPDGGGVHRCEDLRLALGIWQPVVHCEKKRSATGIRSTLVGKAPRHAIVCDDILDTGRTLVACCENLVRAGTERITVCVSHGLFTGEEWKKLWDLKVESIYCTDSVPMQTPSDSRICVLECSRILGELLLSERVVKEPARA